MSDEPVSAYEPWDRVEVYGVGGGTARVYFRYAMRDVIVEQGCLSFKTKEREFQPWPEAVEQLRALMTSWRAMGWDEQADEVERPRCGADDCDCCHERSIYDEMGVVVERVVQVRVALKYCRFYRSDYNSMWRSFLIDEDIPASHAFLTNLSAVGLDLDPDLMGAFLDADARVVASIIDDLVEPEPNGGTDSTPDIVYSKDAFDDAGFNVPTPWYERLQEAKAEAVAPSANILYEDGRLVVGTYGDPEQLSPGMKAAAGALVEAITEGSWVCTNHPPGFEITYPATTLKCEVCGEPKP